MSKPVALSGDIIATPGGVPPAPCTAGSWSAGPVIETLGAKVSQGGTKVVLQAECTFTFTGTQTPPGIPCSGSSKVTLSANPTKLTDNGSDILVLGDTNSDSYGNTLTASPSQTKLKTS